MHSHARRITCGLQTVAAVVLFLAHGTARADTLDKYTIQVLARNGERAGEVAIAKDAVLAVGQMNNKGQIVFITVLEGKGLALVQYSDGQFAVIAVQGGPSPDGKTWPKSMGFNAPVRMNQSGQVVFDPGLPPDGAPYGTYLWDPAQAQLTPVAAKGTPVATGVVLEDVGGGSTLNNGGEVAFTGWVKNAKKEVRPGVFVRRIDGQIEPIAVPDQPLPGRGVFVVNAYDCRINDAGIVGFSAVGKSGPPSNVYVWEKGTISVVAEVGMEIPGVGKMGGNGIFGGNNKNRSIFLNAMVKGKIGYFYWTDGQFTPVAIPDQPMPGGGTFKGWVDGGWGYANELGQYPFIARIAENGKTLTAAYLADADGKLSLVLKSGMTTELGQATIASPGLYGISVNDSGEVALPVQFDHGPASLILLKPITPSGGG